ncbi:hypothetical protein M3194_23625 [Paenibacillus glycanilyticus]|uniref:hypothetical protein n=1 Tax=Paenibacillus glycanilyticus TaxID=126569 RepID=UPI00203C0592|nr:hypothetical protein [Paenibacillus glycanilyticus]MCM3630326.1 hypothetical protein [Paenibacillus glycanilyticus]
MNGFEVAHKQFIEKHLELRTGERKGRLTRGHNHAEKLLLQNVWWPLFGSLEHLHPEYEVYDWNRKSQFLDFAFLPPYGQFGIECDGFQSHVKDMDRERFSYSLNRDTFLTGQGWTMIHFSYDDVQQRPEVCRTLLQHVISPRLIRNDLPMSSIHLAEKEVLRFAYRLGRWIRPKDLIDYLKVDFRTARKSLRSLSSKGMLKPIERGAQIRHYQLTEKALENLL